MVHEPEPSTSRATPGHAGPALDFLWLELTNRCNLQCVHCYSDSHPQSGHRDRMTTQDYEDVMRQAYRLGCRKIQFIGGEPQLHRDFLQLVKVANAIGFDLIEVFTNLTFLSDETVEYAVENQVRFATSVYSDDAAEHDAVTTVRSSHARTIRNLKKLVAKGVRTRAGVISVNQPAGTLERTERFLRSIGVEHVRTSHVREFGRGEALTEKSAGLAGLCGHCWDGKLCVTPDGSALACVMSRDWPVGNVLSDTLEKIVRSGELARLRRTIYDEVWLPRSAPPLPIFVCEPDPPDCGPYEGCPQDHPSCPQSCGPNPCTPDFCGPSTSCPQSCTPPIIVCEPGDCMPDTG